MLYLLVVVVPRQVFLSRLVRVSLRRHVQWAETACEVVKFPPFSFYPDKEVHVQITTNHWNISEKNFVHDATVSWVETVNFENFEVNISNK